MVRGQCPPACRDGLRSIDSATFIDRKHCSRAHFRSTRVPLTDASAHTKIRPTLSRARDRHLFQLWMTTIRRAAEPSMAMACVLLPASLATATATRASLHATLHPPARPLPSRPPIRAEDGSARLPGVGGRRPAAASPPRRRGAPQAPRTAPDPPAPPRLNLAAPVPLLFWGGEV
jgi:hypothetical protein